MLTKVLPMIRRRVQDILCALMAVLLVTQETAPATFTVDSLHEQGRYPLQYIFVGSAAFLPRPRSRIAVEDAPRRWTAMYN
ncbi:hypothetical protein E2C01_018873 [Portunus trituberculatus]|uniref:Uncharacterized protein n=1 Tax=Portunus trituberculatus TaxID=210409 RepID=A0A5B7DVU1_PORTR|nr:hypothetical protein [Portunus trituberculatus]